MDDCIFCKIAKGTIPAKRLAEDAETALRDAQIARHADRHGVHAADQPPVLHLVQRRNVLLGDHQDVHGRLRADVVDHDVALVLVSDLGRDLPRDDLREERFFHGGRPLSVAAQRLSTTTAPRW